MQTCMQALMECQKTCMETMTYCMTKGGKYMDATMMGMMRDCAQMCMMCMNMTIGGSEFMTSTCMLCAQMCEKCAKACEMMGDDAKMMECATACYKCAECCKMMDMEMMPTT
ncbi:four-helix bundle copper-binding protein [Microseira sp. BLCC-F43]|uniref:four-helix bundle copper-binding protein n=1 Tax=Microseira sp. BLCC-F43 TaxID=3153602 RepID=UPI0035B8E97D